MTLSLSLSVQNLTWGEKKKQKNGKVSEDLIIVALKLTHHQYCLYFHTVFHTVSFASVLIIPSDKLRKDLKYTCKHDIIYVK